MVIRTIHKVAGIAVLHMAFLVSAYATSFFGLHLPKKLVIDIWLGGSSSVALVAYVWVLFRSTWLAMEPGRPMKLGLIAITMTLLSLYLGIFIAYDTFGS